MAAESNPGCSADLVGLLKNASETGDTADRAEAVAALKRYPVRQRDAHVLCDTATADDDPALRAVAAQVLGYHRSACRFAEVENALVRRLKQEPDLVVAKSIAFAIRDTAGAWEALESDRIGVQVEAVLGLLLTDGGDWRRGLARFFSELGEGARSAFVRRCRIAPDAAEQIVDFLLSADLGSTTGDPADRAATLLGALDQGALYRALTRNRGGVTRTYAEIWPGLLRRERRDVLLELLREAIRCDGPGKTLVCALAEHAVDCASHADSGRVTRTLLSALGHEGGLWLIAECERMRDGVSDAELGALAALLTDLIRKVPTLTDRVEGVLGNWEPRVPGARLRAFHARLSAG